MHKYIWKWGAPFWFKKDLKQGKKGHLFLKHPHIIYCWKSTTKFSRKSPKKLQNHLIPCCWKMTVFCVSFPFPFCRWCRSRHCQDTKRALQQLCPASLLLLHCPTQGTSAEPVTVRTWPHDQTSKIGAILWKGKLQPQSTSDAKPYQFYWM